MKEKMEFYSRSGNKFFTVNLKPLTDEESKRIRAVNLKALNEIINGFAIFKHEGILGKK